MCSPLHYRLPDTTQQHQTHHGYSYPSSSHLSSHWVRALQPSTAPTVCVTASYPLQHLYNISTTRYNTLQSTALQQFYSLQPLQHPSDTLPRRDWLGDAGATSQSQKVRKSVRAEALAPARYSHLADDRERRPGWHGRVRTSRRSGSWQVHRHVLRRQLVARANHDSVPWAE